jgi:glycopeptide antibiotics resistance protein
MIGSQRKQVGWELGITIVSIFLIIFATLIPFDFSATQQSLAEILRSFLLPVLKLDDLLGNVFLFVPFGFGLTAHAGRKRVTRHWALAAMIMMASFGLSLTVEVLQIFLSSRTTSLSDVLTNTIGGWVGYLCFRWGRDILFEYFWKFTAQIRKLISLKSLTLGFIGYLVFTCGLLISLQNTTKLSNWDPGATLAIGNEPTGDRPWQGYVDRVRLANQSLNQAEINQLFSGVDILTGKTSLLVDYRFSDINEAYPDLTGNGSGLAWRDRPTSTQDSRGILLTPNAWLKTVKPVNLIADRVNVSSEFTLSLTIATDDLNQRGPARIFAFSRDEIRSNLVLGQDKTDLVVRLRTPISGANGTYSPLIIPNFFADQRSHDIIVTYTQPNLSLYVDKTQHAYIMMLTPERILLKSLFSFAILGLEFNWTSIILSQLIYYGFIFVPLGSCLALITILIRGQLISRVLLIGNSILIPALIVEGINLQYGLEYFRPERLLLGITVMSITMLGGRHWFAPQ